ncbi:26991_t:CDS:1, partial [Racocetra persica]
VSNTLNSSTNTNYNYLCPLQRTEEELFSIVLTKYFLEIPDTVKYNSALVSNT